MLELSKDQQEILEKVCGDKVVFITIFGLLRILDITNKQTIYKLLSIQRTPFQKGSLVFITSSAKGEVFTLRDKKTLNDGFCSYNYAIDSNLNTLNVGNTFFQESGHFEKSVNPEIYGCLLKDDSVIDRKSLHTLDIGLVNLKWLNLCQLSTIKYVKLFSYLEENNVSYLRNGNSLLIENIYDLKPDSRKYLDNLNMFSIPKQQGLVSHHLYQHE